MGALADKAKEVTLAAAAKESKKSTAALWIAGVLSVGYLIFAGYLFLNFVRVAGDDKQWDHAVVLLNAMSAIGFSAFGVLLGTTVQQVNVANAKKETAKVKASEVTLIDRGAKLVEEAKKQLDHTADVKAHGINVTNQVKLWADHAGNETELNHAIGEMEAAIKAAES